MKCRIALIMLSTLILAPASWAQAKHGSSSVPRNYADLANASPWGVGTSSNTARKYGTWIPKMARAGVTWVRYLPGWGPLQTAPKSPLKLQKLDALVRTAHANHVFLSGMLLYNARWVHPFKRLPTANLDQWSGYVRGVVGQLRGQVDYFEIWNEPLSFHTAGQTSTDYAKTVVAAYDAAKKANPKAQVGMTVNSVAVDYLRQTIGAGARNHFDYICVHPYEIFDGLRWGDEPLFMHIAPTIHKMLRADDPARAKCPVWITEINGKARGKERAGDLVKTYTMGIAEGIARICWFEAMGEAYKMGLLNDAGEPTLSYKALQTLTTTLGPVPEYLGWLRPDGRDYAFVFRTPDSRTVMVAWSQVGHNSHLKFGRPVEMIDPLTGKKVTASKCELSNSPLLIEDIPTDMLAKAKANRNNPFSSWDGRDYTHAHTVSWVATKDGANPAGLDVCVVKPQTTTFAGKRALYVGATPHPGIAFAVDPNFLSFTSHPITITAEVAAKEDAGGGFNVWWEARGGQHKAGWFNVPHDGHWHTITIHIPSDQFVSDWAYNFRFASGSDAQKRYYIHSVTVSKD